MRIEALHLGMFRSFAHCPTPLMRFKNLNVLVGPNNAGKSSILRALGFVQVGMPPPVEEDRRIGLNDALVLLELSGPFGPNGLHEGASGYFAVRYENNSKQIQRTFQVESDTLVNTDSIISPDRPWNFIVPFLSNRKVASYQEQFNAEQARRLSLNFSYLSARLSNLNDPSMPESVLYREACMDILGFVVYAAPSQNGQLPAFQIDTDHVIPISSLGSGVVHIVSLLVELATASNKCFLMEELETDLHPAALKKLLDLILESSTRNQFVISTHSNIVVRQLGSHPDTAIFAVEATNDRPPVSSVRVIGNAPSDRIGLLRDLGYELADFDAWDGWLLLEEASAEDLVRSVLIPMFEPRLVRRIRTVSGRGNARTKKLFDDYNRLFVFLHLAEHYVNRAWVVLDGDDQSKELVRQLKDQYSSWNPDAFRNLSKNNIEEFYPLRFASEVADVASAPSATKKKELVKQVIAWAQAEPEEAKVELAESAVELVDLLHEFADTLALG